MKNIEQGPIVAKFGGSSLAHAGRVEKVKNIVQSDPDRKFVVVSAPGKGDKRRPSQRQKITDFLITGDFGTVRDRFVEMGNGLQVPEVTNWLEEIEAERDGRDQEWFESRGEWLMAKVFSQFLGGSFVDAAQLIKLKDNGEIDPLTYSVIKEQMYSDNVYVIPGYYGTNSETGVIQCFPRGGSDITGAIIAKGVGARLYENWTDVSGILSADPHIVKKPKGIERITYEEMGELAFRGADVLQMDEVGPAREARIPINVRNTLNPDYPGTMIVDQRLSLNGEDVIGISSRGGFAAFQIAKAGMDKRHGELAKITNIFADQGVSIEQGPGGLDYVSFICHTDQLKGGKEQDVMIQLHEDFKPDNLTLLDDIGLVAVVGQRIKRDPTDVNAKIYSTLSKYHIRTGAHIQPVGASTIVLSVENRDLTRTVGALYGAFIE